MMGKADYLGSIAAEDIDMELLTGVDGFFVCYRVAGGEDGTASVFDYLRCEVESSWEGCYTRLQEREGNRGVPVEAARMMHVEHPIGGLHNFAGLHQTAGCDALISVLDGVRKE